MLTAPRTPRSHTTTLRSRNHWPAVFAAAVVALAAASAAAQTPPVLLPASTGSTEANPGAGEGDLRTRLTDPAGLVIRGEALHGDLLRAFYASFNFQPVWSTRPRQAEALLGAVWRAGEHGLDPELFHAALLRNPGALPPIERELLLSDAFLAYANALARGAMPIAQRVDDEDLAPEAVDVPAALVGAIDSADPAGAIVALAPRAPEYLALRRALQAYNQSSPGAPSRPGGRGAADKNANELRQLVVNLERWRWLPRDLPADRVWVNAANAQLVLYRGDRSVFTTRVVVGQPTWQTPEFETSIEALLFNPPWNVPPSIAEQEILPKLAHDPDYLARHHMIRRANGGLQQLPGNGTALGFLKFEMPNRFDVYLHDTPMKQLFSRDNRRQSHGCIRVQNPRELAALLIDQPVETINHAIAGGATARRNLVTPTRVFIVYHTAFAGANGSIEFRPDVYGRDGAIWQHLHKSGQPPVAERDQTGQRRG